jgi:hypothetical protein
MIIAPETSVAIEVSPLTMIAPAGYRFVPLGMRCAICKTREAQSYWKNGLPYCPECRQAGKWEAPAPMIRASEQDTVSEQEAPALAPEHLPQAPAHLHAVLTENALVIADHRTIRTIPVNELPTSIASVCDLANAHDVTHVWIMPGLPIAMIASDETWDVFSSWTASRDDSETGATRSQEDMYQLWLAGENHPLFTRMWKRGRKSDPMCRQVKIGFPERGDWVWNITSPIDILAAISYLEEVLHVVVEWSPGHIGTELVKHLNRTANRQAWIRETSIDLFSLPIPWHKTARDIVWSNPSIAQYQGLFLYQFDKRSAYLSSCPGVYVGAGDPVHATEQIDTTLPGVYRVTVSEQGGLFDDVMLPAILTTEWITDDVLTYACSQGYTIDVHEGYQWEEKHKTLESYAKKLWESRHVFRTDTARFPHEQGRKNAENTMKEIALIATGKFASKKKASRFMRPDWWAKIVGKTRVNILRNLKTFAERGYMPVLIYSDSLYFVSDNPNPREAIPGILAREHELGGYRHEGTWTITPELVEAFATLRASAVQKLLEHTPQLEG